MCVKTKMLFAHNNTSLLHICFYVVKDKKKSATTGQFKIDKLTSSVNNKRNTMLYQGTIIQRYCSSYYTIPSYICIRVPWLYTRVMKINNTDLRYNFTYK